MSEHNHSHEYEQDHSHEHEHTHEHEHSHSHEHNHGHYHENTKAVINRLNRAIGHLEKVRDMVEEGRDCTEVLVQIAAVKSAINNTGKLILTDHMEHCIVHAIEDGDVDAIKDLEEAINKFVK